DEEARGEIAVALGFEHVGLTVGRLGLADIRERETGGGAPDRPHRQRRGQELRLRPRRGIEALTIRTARTTRGAAGAARTTRTAGPTTHAEQHAARHRTHR